MNTFCPTPENPCTDPAVPVVNYSSEAPDNLAYFGRKYNPGLQPPLGSPWRSTGCIGTCVSEVSQAEADLCAARQVITCLAGEWPVYEDNPSTDPDQPPVITRDRQTFDNDPQSCDFTCPDGEVFTYTIPAGTVRAFSQAAADASALSMACNGAIDNRICIGELSPQGCCVGSDYLATVNVSSPRLGQQGVSMVVTVSDGVLPPGLGLDYDDTTFTISGTATSAGQYQFTIQVDLQEEGFAASFMQKTFTIYVQEIVQDTLAGALNSTPYSETLTTVGSFGDVTWAIASGALPTGLTLSTTGTISGTPSGATGTYTFTVSAQDGVGTVCTKEFSMELTGVDYGELVWSLQSQQQDGTGVATWVSPGAGGTGSTWSAFTSATIAPGADVGRLIIRATMVYAGPNLPGRVQVDVSGNNQVFGEGGSNASSVQFFIDNIIQASASMAAPPPTFNGVYTLDFTASAGVLLFVIDMLSSNPTGAQGNPLTLNVSGSIINL